MPKFQPGDVCKIKLDAQIKKVQLEKYRGEEVELLCFMGAIPACSLTEFDWWEVRHADGYTFYATESVLEKRPPPQRNWAREVLYPLINQQTVHRTQESQELRWARSPQTAEQ